jgi:hypothetical protein
MPFAALTDLVGESAKVVGTVPPLRIRRVTVRPRRRLLSVTIRSPTADRRRVALGISVRFHFVVTVPG